MKKPEQLNETSRRTFIRSAAAFASGAALFPLAIAASKPAEDFLILPKGMPAPRKVITPSETDFEFHSLTFKSAEQLAKQLPFAMYGIPQGHDLALREASAGLGKNKRIQSATLVYGSDRSHETYRDWTLSITATRSFHRPYVLWNDEQSETVFSSDFLPRPGIITKSRCGSFFHWIEKRTLYQIQTHVALSMEQARELATSLTRFS